MIRIILHVALCATLLCAAPAHAQAPNAPPDAPQAATAPEAPPPIPPRAFRSPEEGFAALMAALRENDDRALIATFGSVADRLVRSGDRTADRAAREAVAAGYAVRSEILRPTRRRAVLQLGSDDWPLPIPMTERNGAWRFDAAAITAFDPGPGWVRVPEAVAPVSH